MAEVKNVCQVEGDPSFVTHNLSKQQRDALRDLSLRTDITIKPSDKGGAIVVMDTTQYIAEIERQLADGEVYKPLSSDPLLGIIRKIKTLLDYMVDRGVITDKLRNYLMVRNPVTPTIYVLPKIHKDPVCPPGRPIVAGIDSVFCPLAIMLDKVLSPLIQEVPSYIRDTGHFLHKLQSLGNVGEGVILATLDVASLYTSIPHSDGLEASQWILREGAQYSVHQIDFFLQALEIILCCNYFTFREQYYLQLRGTAMGSNVAPSYANAFMARLEQLHIYLDVDFSRHCLAWWRYIDDVFVLWRGDVDSLQRFHGRINGVHPSISFTLVYDLQKIHFLDVLVYKDLEGSICTSLFTKPRIGIKFFILPVSTPHIRRNQSPLANSQGYRG
ncbi:uncharacterized protein LOC121397091 isoform X1 [Xenopus laevis]|uniref:Uncharacterized protein LOC121397091 isoform X1 n=1 Tax=Xenopus laevis TaxID=8355 RepID=A0A8J1LHK5_XENLA|nr:uncharacterized protein LOC121397091 isoform X1 [Xenopus laevis]